jgi:hypothetical protein
MSGVNGYVSVDDGGGENIVLQVRSWTFNHEKPISDYTVLGATGGYRNKYEDGGKNWSGSFEVYWDPADTTGQKVLEDSMIASNDTVDIKIYPSLATPPTPATGDKYYGGTVYVSTGSVDGASTGLVGQVFNFEGDGQPTIDTEA